MRAFIKKSVSLLLAAVLLVGLAPGITLTAQAEDTSERGIENLRFDDHVDMTCKVVEVIDAGMPTSYQVGYGVEENAVLDTAVVTLEGDTLVATGIGTAKVKIDGETYEITVTAAPISLLLLIGQSNMRGSEGNADQSIICPDGMVYATFGDDRGDVEGIMNVSNATNFAASALTGEYSAINVNGTTDNLSYYPINSLTEAGKGTFGPDSGFAYEWVKQTGEKVWIVNAAHGGSSITSWQPNATNFKEAVLLFSACQNTLRKEITAGHYTLSHMGYFWCQGCSDYSWSAEKYVINYLAMHDGLKVSLAFDYDGNDATTSHIFEFAGIIPVRAGHDYNDGYREGTYTDTTSHKFEESFKDLQMTGPRVAQYWMCNNPELTDIWMVCNIGEDWVWMPDGTNGVTEYFQSHYPNGTVDYTTQVQQFSSWYTPTTPKAVHDSIHYNQIGYNEVGREAARNALIMLGEVEAPEVETTVELLSWDGYTPVNSIAGSQSGNSGTLVVPKVSPVWKTKDVTYILSNNLNWNYYDLLAKDETAGGTLQVNGLDITVTVDKMQPYSHFAEHLAQLPEEICCGMNLWNVLEYEDVYYANGTEWGSHTSGNVPSITISVAPGDQIYASSFEKAVTNGHATADGIRVTFFSKYGVAKTMNPAETYKEFVANGGYLVAPENAVAINIAMWSKSDDWEVYLLNKDHIGVNGTCRVCGTHTHEWSEWSHVTEPTADALGVDQRTCACGEIETREVKGVWQIYDLNAHLLELPKDICCDTNLWAILPHEDVHFTSGKTWGKTSTPTTSITIPVNPGDKIYATSWNQAGENGHATSNGIRLTFFDANGIALTLGPGESYRKFAANGGYLVAPEGTIAINIVMWYDSEDYEVYILNREHCYENGICTACGEDSVTAALEGNVLSLSGELTVGTKILVSCYNGERFAGTKILVWQGQPLQETIPEGERVKLLFVDKNWLPMRKPINVK